jgi:hypothetical protein
MLTTEELRRLLDNLGLESVPLITKEESEPDFLSKSYFRQACEMYPILVDYPDLFVKKLGDKYAHTLALDSSSAMTLLDTLDEYKSLLSYYRDISRNKYVELLNKTPIEIFLELAEVYEQVKLEMSELTVLNSQYHALMNAYMNYFL